MRTLVEFIHDPVALTLFLLLGAAILHGKAPRGARVLFIAAWIFLYLLSTPAALNWMTNRWYIAGHWEISADCDLEAVVVLGASAGADVRAPPNIRLSGVGLARLLEGARIHRACKGSRLIVSGCGHEEPKVCYASVAARMAIELLGLQPESVSIVDQAINTEQEARLIASLLDGRRFALVSSASHLRRARMMFKAEGATPSAWSGVGVRNEAQFDFKQLLPSIHALGMSAALLHEVLGVAWWRLKQFRSAF